MKIDEVDIIDRYKSKKHQISRFHPRYLEVFEYRFGLIDGVTHSQKETGKKFGVSGTRIRQMEERIKYELSML